MIIRNSERYSSGTIKTGAVIAYIQNIPVVSSETALTIYK